MTAYLSYLVGDVLHLSGILSLFVSAVAISHYALHNISTESRTTTIYSFQTLSYISEGIIFVYCGMDALDPLKWKVSSGERKGAAGGVVGAQALQGGTDGHDMTRGAGDWVCE